ncbi:acyltransferase [Hufsiella ginkgonis]|uniref:Acyltransferase n=1 Tax=Hufsiella ginkgonis TaxID=2695274 RepID=A0A7K1Y2E0_9SPHI|nr:acyltransferase [Hufsiella ginkgonis]MXV17443.1 acyltransferase [Hufsiella ginkgonis]
MLLKIFTFFLPWPLRRRALQRWFGYKIHPGAKIGLAWIFPGKLEMAEGARIGHFTVAIHLDLVKMERKASLGRGNWITGFPTNGSSPHFKHQPGRQAALFIGEEAAVTKNHHLDCTNRIEIGRFSTVAGYRSQFLTHSINVMGNRQDSAPITIGEYTFVGTNVVVLGGAVLPARSVLGAKSLLNKAYTEEWKLYGGVPAAAVGDISREAKYFARAEGFVF